MLDRAGWLVTGNFWSQVWGRLQLPGIAMGEDCEGGPRLVQIKS